MSLARTLALAAVLVLASPLAEAGKRDADPEMASMAKGKAPKGYTELRVVGVTQTPMGMAVILNTVDRGRLLPMWVGETEAATIGLRYAGKAPPRPVTHDLLDTVLAELGGTVTEVRITGLVDQAFAAEIRISGGKGKELVLDARASDAIALALGHELPLWVADEVVEENGLDPDLMEAPEPRGRKKRGDVPL